MKKVFIFIGVIIIACVGIIICLFNNKSYETYILCSNDVFYFDNNYKVELEDNKIGNLNIERKSFEDGTSSLDYCIKGTFKNDGKTILVLTDTTNNKFYYDLSVNDKSFTLNRLDDSYKYLSNIKMEIKKDTLTKKGCTVVITDTTGLDNTYGEYFYLEKYENGWISINTKEKVFFNEIGYKIDKNNKVEVKTNFENIYGELESGKYRIIKDVTIEDNKYSFDTEFEIN